MKYLFALLFASALLAGCPSSKDNRNTEAKLSDDRFAAQFRDIAEIAGLRQLTKLKKDMMPFFSPSGDRIYFSRLLIENPDDINGMFSETNRSYFSLDYGTDKLFMLQGIPRPPAQNVVAKDSLPKMVLEKPLYGIRYDSILYFNTEGGASDARWNIYKLVDDSMSQITYGDQGSLLNVVSPDGRYLAFTYGNDSLRLVIMNTVTGRYYVVPKTRVEADRFDFAPQFSPDSKYMVFLRSGDLYRQDLIPFGDIWLVEFRDSSS